MWEPITKLIEKYPSITLGLILVYIVATGAFAAYRWIYSAYSEAKKEYLKKLALYCEDVSDIAGQIAASDHYPKELIAKFWAYYYGKLILVENEKLEEMMVALGNVLEETTPQNHADMREDIEDAVLDVSGACRDLIKESWNLAIVPWKDLQAKKIDQNQDEQAEKEKDRISKEQDQKQLRDQNGQDQKQNVTSK